MKTTLNVHVDVLEKITRAARRCKVSRSDIIISLMKMVMDNTGRPAGLGKAVRYQKKKSPDQWHRFHIQLRNEEYEYFLDLRKVLKMSVSRILAYAVKKYLDVILKKIKSDNYRFQSYFLSLDIVNKVKIWKLCWGQPQNNL